ncbi:hypothetical protein CYLTODRAFT_454736 [Cylindrobasidium torrendii FP15055 ss-10]|uniref:Uncharacterized protein n=1 Tax=Cylindrobasidium torrendii FP15055 ss-10 TaxID=1314674 RepID=A0A0D7B9B8_9AGAR|nr:hypothetical protein CYLTODRAFT_454736 [Cylindrobasidium torrendii FP15055 ss-10]
MTPSGVAAQSQQSLPSFAQAFSPSSLGQLSQGSRIALPPIQTQSRSSRMASPANNKVSFSRPPSEDPATATGVGTGKKRARPDDSDEQMSVSDSHSPRVKEEQVDQEGLTTAPSATSKRVDELMLQDTSGAPPPSSVHPLKRRRVTVSGPPQPGALNTDVRVPRDQQTTTPISPVVIGFTLQRDNPNAAEQVRSMITVKQQQKALIEQRRGSVVGLVTPPAPAPPGPVSAHHAPSPHHNQPTPSHSGHSLQPQSARTVRPNQSSAPGRRMTNASHPASSQRPPSPGPAPGPSNSTFIPQSLPPPPISFARRRADHLGGGKKKPADILISPREGQGSQSFAPAIQSAPPIPRADGQQGSFSAGRSMALPRLPSVLGHGDNAKKAATGVVPPTPTRLTLRGPPTSGLAAIPGISQSGTGRSPPASVAIASTLVPPTPSMLSHPGYSGDKAGFLAPFETFYDALSDSKQLKAWLGDQLGKSQALMQSLNQKHEQLQELIDTAVDRRVGAMRAEMGGMQRRIEHLEDVVRAAQGGPSSARRGSIDYPPPPPRPVPRNGVMPPDSYTFPPVPPMDRDRRVMQTPDERNRMMSPSWHGGDGRDSESESPAPFSSRRLSLSATRLDNMDASGSRGYTHSTSPTQMREREAPISSKMSQRRPTLNRQQSSPRMSTLGPPPPPPTSLRRADD